MGDLFFSILFSGENSEEEEEIKLIHIFAQMLTHFMEPWFMITAGGWGELSENKRRKS
jgi:hypothetical protein